jgi:tetratricopeptide (TPR) repeat protein
MKKNEKGLHENFVEDYSQILPVFIYPDEKKSQNMYPDMDKVIDKCSQVIERHSIYLRRKEHVKWIDDSYFLIGKARLYKEQYEQSKETFLYVYQAFKKTPERYKGLNWLIRSHIETEDWGKAQEFLDLGEDNLNKMPEEYKSMYYASYADYHLKKDQDFQKAIINLESAIKFAEEKEDRRRYSFILGQIHQKQRDFVEATKYYTEVLKLNPEYIMSFNARINRAIAYDVTSAGSEDIKKELKKMLKDSKNEEFRDQIYYALAELALKEDDEPLAIDYLKKSTRFSVSNNKQKALSYLKLADIYFEQPEYVKAQAHFDSTLQYLPEDHPEYYEAESKNNSLQDLVKNLKEIERLDSLLALANMSEKDRRKKVEKMIEEMKAEEERKKQAELLALQRAQEEATNQGLINSASFGSGRKGKWYFYNASTMAIGTSEFTNVWGNRQLEDNWRRKSKGSTFKETNEENSQPKGEQQEKKTEVAENSLSQEEKYDPEAYLKNIPVEMEEQLEAHGKVAEALFNVGTIFKESFNDNPSAIGAFNRIITQYDTSQYNLPAHYQLYRIYLTEGNQEKMQVQKDWVLDNHPFSEYAYLIKNPDHNKQSKATKEKIEEYYEATYRLYDYGLYNDVIESCNKADEVFKENHIQAKFDFLKAKSTGYVKSKAEFKIALESVVKDHPEDPVKERAQAILNYMNNSQNNSLNSNQNSGPTYVQNPNEQYMFIMSLAESTPNARNLKIQLANFNQQFFSEQKFEFTTSSLPERTLYLIRTFDDEMKAMRYLNTVKNNNKLMAMVQQMKAKNYIISMSNFRILFKDKNEQAYLNFFNKKYPG